MPSKVACASGSLILFITCCGLAPPAHAGWARKLTNTILPPVLRHAAASLIQKEVYDVEEPQPNYSNFDSNVYQPTPSSAYGQYLGPQPSSSPSSSSSSPKPFARTKSGKSFSRDAQSAVTNSFESSEPQQAQEQPIEEEKPTFSKHHYNYLSGNTNDSDTVPSGTPFYQAFEHGSLGQQPFATMVANRVFISTPLHGSVFKRKDTIKYIILHSTETASPADAKRVIQSWNNRGLRHPGAQFVVDRDGAIYATANPDLATVHINTKKTSAEYSNDNSVGIEIVRAGKQRYTQPQLNSVMYLVSYLQQHYQVPDQNVTTHHRVQASDRSDPVGFDLLAFSRTKSDFENQAIVWSGAHSVPATTTTVASAPDDSL